MLESLFFIATIAFVFLFIYFILWMIWFSWKQRKTIIKEVRSQKPDTALIARVLAWLFTR